MVCPISVCLQCPNLMNYKVYVLTQMIINVHKKNASNILTDFLWELINSLHIYFFWKTLTSWFHNSQAEYLYPWQVRQNIFDTFKTHLLAILRTWSSLTEKCLFCFSAKKVADLTLKKEKKNLLTIIKSIFLYILRLIFMPHFHAFLLKYILNSSLQWCYLVRRNRQIFSRASLFSLFKLYWAYLSCTWNYLCYISILNALY